VGILLRNYVQNFKAEENSEWNGKPTRVRTNDNNALFENTILRNRKITVGELQKWLEPVTRNIPHHHSEL
jgi:hypothetical protein